MFTVNLKRFSAAKNTVRITKAQFAALKDAYLNITEAYRKGEACSEIKVGRTALSASIIPGHSIALHQPSRGAYERTTKVEMTEGELHQIVTCGKVEALLDEMERIREQKEQGNTRQLTQLYDYNRAGAVFAHGMRRALMTSYFYAHKAWHLSHHHYPMPGKDELPLPYDGYEHVLKFCENDVEKIIEKIDWPMLRCTVNYLAEVLKFRAGRAGRNFRNISMMFSEMEDTARDILVNSMRIKEALQSPAVNLVFQSLGVYFGGCGKSQNQDILQAYYFGDGVVMGKFPAPVNTHVQLDDDDDTMPVPVQQKRCSAQQDTEHEEPENKKKRMVNEDDSE